MARVHYFSWVYFVRQLDARYSVEKGHGTVKAQDDVLKTRALAILRVIEHGEEVSQRDIAEKIDSSLGTTNQALKSLIDNGIVQAEEVTTRKGKRGFLYHLTARGIEEKFNLVRDCLMRCQRDAEEIASEIERLKAELNHR